MLYMVMLGGSHPKANTELHDVVFVAGDNLEQTYPQLRALWFAAPEGLHIDAWMSIAGVDAYAVSLSDTPAKAGPKLFFINLGGYVGSVFGEDHRYLVVAAENKAEAKKIAKQQLSLKWDKPHTDNVFEIEQCVAVEQVAGRYIQLHPAAHNGCYFENDYIVIG
ncbi:DUF1543 domain-containing protein [Arsukibacterium indicum]|uniref:DUF1543 domain-containing protein n=1 Tax=Arsukibacterium indicum TaxID=2848612 RepID=A0ABS6MMQ0_9GAMM|nr:DUF1543 domain-containing protein [Arsukibacterium indicum]MBV2129855.1 DUF1543 domain-containing protein [Arsukibacterium indicum]